MVLARVLVHGIHPHGRDAEVARLGAGIEDPRAAIFGAVKGRKGNPALVQTLFHVFAEVFVVGVSRAVGFIKVGLEGGAGGASEGAEI